ncbi:MAG: hypothetical protein LBD60_01870 [Puniceicoccales bacterium]|jgi:hypothetical protein|nr:hypothetical protein [Puniceicoccales bacterium]
MIIKNFLLQGAAAPPTFNSQLLIWRPNSAILHEEGLVILRSPEGSEIEWENLISVQSKFGNIYNGFTDDSRLISIAHMVDRGRLNIPLGLPEKPLEVRFAQDDSQK